MHSLNEKGQEEAPFEILVAVVIMGFVLLAGYVAMKQVQGDICEQKIEKQIDDFRAALEEVVVKQGSVDIILDFPKDCYSEKHQSFAIVHIDDEPLCRHFCGGIRKNCMILKYTDQEVGLAWNKCINIPPQTNFPKLGSLGSCPIDGKFADFLLQDLKDDIPQGRYVLLNKTVTGNVPTICAYKK